MLEKLFARGCVIQPSDNAVKIILVQEQLNPENLFFSFQRAVHMMQYLSCANEQFLPMD